MNQEFVVKLTKWTEGGEKVGEVQQPEPKKREEPRRIGFQGPLRGRIQGGYSNHRPTDRSGGQKEGPLRAKELAIFREVETSKEGKGVSTLQDGVRARGRRSLSMRWRLVKEGEGEEPHW